MGGRIWKMREFYYKVHLLQTGVVPARTLLTTRWHCRPAGFEIVLPSNLRRSRESTRGRTVFNVILNDPPKTTTTSSDGTSNYSRGGERESTNRTIAE